MNSFEEFIHQHQKAEVREYPNQTPDEPLVSIRIQTYQQAGYIRECLDSILMQKTNFPYEILLGEDESNDGTRTICLEYAEKYPEKIRLFLHSRANNYVVNGRPTGRFASYYSTFKARGKYIAICEGDDYWTDPHKIQKQVSYLEKKMDYTVSFHPVRRVHDDHPHLNSDFGPPSPGTTEGYTIKNIIEMGDGGFMPTNSMVYRRESILDYPEWALNAVVGDLPLALVLASRGRIHYIPEVMGAYRVNSEGSWSTAMQKVQLKRKRHQGLMDIWNAFDQWSGNKYHQLIGKAKRKLMYRYYKFRIKKSLRGLYESVFGKE